MSSLVIELSLPDSVSAFCRSGHEIKPNSAIGQCLADCRKSGDCESACRFVLSKFKPEFRIVKLIDGKYENVLAGHLDKVAICRSIYFESDTNFRESEEWCAIYLVWEAACSLDD